MLDRVADLARRQADLLATLRAPPAITGARRLGTISAVEIGGSAGYLSDLAPRLLGFFRERGVLLRPLGNTVYVTPSYCISEAELEAVYIAIAEACDI